MIGSGIMTQPDSAVVPAIIPNLWMIGRAAVKSLAHLGIFL